MNRDGLPSIVSKVLIILLPGIFPKNNLFLRFFFIHRGKKGTTQWAVQSISHAWSSCSERKGLARFLEKRPTVLISRRGRAPPSNMDEGAPKAKHEVDNTPSVCHYPNGGT
jgi:hypothetical protein